MLAEIPAPALRACAGPASQVRNQRGWAAGGKGVLRSLGRVGQRLCARQRSFAGRAAFSGSICSSPSKAALLPFLQRVHLCSQYQQYQQHHSHQQHGGWGGWHEPGPDPETVLPSATTVLTSSNFRALVMMTYKPWLIMVGGDVLYACLDLLCLTPLLVAIIFVLLVLACHLPPSSTIGALPGAKCLAWACNSSAVSCYSPTPDARNLPVAFPQCGLLVVLAF